MRIADETLNHLGEAFISAKLGEIFKISFYQYIARPQLYNHMYRLYQRGAGVTISRGLAHIGRPFNTDLRRVQA